MDRVQLILTFKFTKTLIRLVQSQMQSRSSLLMMGRLAIYVNLADDAFGVMQKSGVMEG